MYNIYQEKRFLFLTTENNEKKLSSRMLIANEITYVLHRMDRPVFFITIIFNIITLWFVLYLYGILTLC